MIHNFVFLMQNLDIKIMNVLYTKTTHTKYVLLEGGLYYLLYIYIFQKIRLICIQLMILYVPLSDQYFGTLFLKLILSVYQNHNNKNVARLLILCQDDIGGIITNVRLDI